MKLSIITINRNNAAGLEKTMKSVVSQTFKEYEYIVVDGASSDNSVEVIKSFESQFAHLSWVSEPDSGIYNAMNKGIRMASGDYIQILNSGDCLAADDVTERMLEALDKAGNPSILYGNMIKCFPDGRRYVDNGYGGQKVTFLLFYLGTLNHDPTYIRRSLFEKYGYYDENLKIVSDWKWFMNAIIEGGEKPKYVDINVTLFDMTGVSESNAALVKEEREAVLRQTYPAALLADYERYADPIERYKRLQRHPWALRLTAFIERVLFKKEKRIDKKKNIL
ncbi:MAG: glycosyltransferase [Bacteroidales bacterium]|nr:glycosyltransferase [Bacteroidales bacterium]